MGIYGQYYEITLALQRAVQGRYDESEQHLRRAEELAPAIRDPQAIAPTIGVRMRLLLARGHYDIATDLPARDWGAAFNELILAV